jgi:hypothetical protein
MNVDNLPDSFKINDRYWRKADIGHIGVNDRF